MGAVLVMRVIEKDNAATGERDEVTAVRLLQDLTVEHELRRTVHNHASSQGNNVVEALRRAGKIVRGRDHGLAACSLSIKDAHDLLLGYRINSRDRFIEEVELWIGGECACNKDTASLTT
jgi:hypothetical protein